MIYSGVIKMQDTTPEMEKIERDGKKGEAKKLDRALASVFFSFSQPSLKNVNNAMVLW